MISWAYATLWPRHASVETPSADNGPTSPSITPIRDCTQADSAPRAMYFLLSAVARLPIQHRQLPHVPLGHLAGDLARLQQPPDRLVERDHPLLAVRDQVVVDALQL